jgi:hypothetical protein
MTPRAIQVISLDGIEARIFHVTQGYRVEVSSTLNDYWHPGIFPDFQQLEEWLQSQLAMLSAGFPLSGDWLMLESDFDTNEIYRGWFIDKAAQNWQGYDPLTNCCYSASTRKALKAKINQIEDERLSHPMKASVL